MRLAWWATLVSIVGIIAWALLGLSPFMTFRSHADAGVFGDSFGMATSFFGSIGLIVAGVALILQIRETHDSGLREVEQRRLQAEQMEITKRTAEQQLAMVRDAQRTQAMSALIQVENDAFRFQRAVTVLFDAERIQINLPERRLRRMELGMAEDELRGHRTKLLILFGERSTPLSNSAEHIIEASTHALSDLRADLDVRMFGRQQADIVRSEILKLWADYTKPQ